MTKENKKALDLYKVWVTKFHFYEGLSQEEWKNLQTGQGLEELMKEWKKIHPDPAAALDWAHNYVCTLVEEGRESELPKDIRELVKNWNLHK